MLSIYISPIKIHALNYFEKIQLQNQHLGGLKFNVHHTLCMNSCFSKPEKYFVKRETPSVPLNLIKKISSFRICFVK